MSELYNFPFKNQLASSDINAYEDCLPTCIAAGLQYLLNKPYDGGDIKDAVYGKQYYGGTAAVNYISYCASQGVRLYSKSGSPSYLDAQVHFWLGQNCPVIATEPSTYAPPADTMNPGPSHCIVFYKDSANNLLSMNPYRAFTQAGTDDYWESVFCYGQVWIMQLPSKGTAPLNIPHGWKLSSDHTTLVAPNGHYLRHAFKDFVLAHDWNPGDEPSEEEHANPAVFGGTCQVLGSIELTWDSKSGVQPHFLGGEFVVLRQSLIDAQAQNAQLTAQLVALQNAPKPEPNAQLLAQLNAVEAQLSSVIGSFHQATPTSSVPIVQAPIPPPQGVPVVPPPAANVAAGTNFNASLS